MAARRYSATKKGFPSEWRVRKVASAGHQIGCHSGTHSLVHLQTPAAFREETRRSISAITEAISAPVECYRAPGFSITPSSFWAFEILRELGITTDCSVFPGRHAHGGTGTAFPSTPFRIQVNGQTLMEFPMSLASLGPVQVAFAGGGYFRLLPLSWISRWTRASPYVMTYFHPRDFDPDQPRIQGLSPFRSFKAYVGLKGSFAKLDQYLGQFGGQSLADAQHLIDWKQAPSLQL